MTQSQSEFLHSKKTPRSSLAGDRFEFLRALVASGGPEVSDYQQLSTVLAWFHEVGFGEIVRRVLAPTLTVETMQGFSYLRPHGYSGDYEVIDRIYSFWHASDPQLIRWDQYFHAQTAPRAVRNRKAYFGALVDELDSTSRDHVGQVLNIGSGPGRDIEEYLNAHPDVDVHIDSIDSDAKAVAFASQLCAPHASRVAFNCLNALKYNPTKRYDLIWSAGLLDYFSERTFKMFVKRYYAALAPGGSLVIGNFGPGNTSRAYMELVGDWHLHHRSRSALIAIGESCGVETSKIQVDEEAEGVNLFLRLRA